jgi:hypothetical protein
MARRRLIALWWALGYLGLWFGVSLDGAAAGLSRPEQAPDR